MTTKPEQAVSEAADRMKQLEHVILAGVADLAKLHAEFGFPESQNIDTEDMITALREMRCAFHINMLRAYPEKSHDEITNEIALILRGRFASRPSPDKAALAGWVAQGQPVACGACHGSGWVPRDPDIGTEQECFSCGGSGVDTESSPGAVSPPLVPKAGLTDDQIEALFHALDGKSLIVGENQMNWNKVVRLAFARAVERHLQGEE